MVVVEPTLNPHNFYAIQFGAEEKNWILNKKNIDYIVLGMD